MTRPHSVDDGATAMELSNRHRDTIEHIFNRPSSGNVEWSVSKSPASWSSVASCDVTRPFG